MKFIDLHVHSSLSVGVDAPEKMLNQAKVLGTDIGLCDGLKGNYLSGIDIYAKGKKELKSKLKKKLDYTLVQGGDYNINRLAVLDKRVDILAHPDFRRKDSGVDSIIARAASENKVAIEINLGRIINSRGLNRIHLIKNLRKNFMLATKYNAPLVATTESRSLYELRGGDGIFHLLSLLGFNEKAAIDAMYNVPKKILRGDLKLE
jgi:ribonuclease P/MRP protein subunit RPP1|tara:strand:+ start:310 stop:924 length:615 start_codon:yes stop_codon:yes gene_type:complete